jgi:hypothetical protein
MICPEGHLYDLLIKAERSPPEKMTNTPSKVVGEVVAVDKQMHSRDSAQ